METFVGYRMSFGVVLSPAMQMRSYRSALCLTRSKPRSTVVDRSRTTKVNKSRYRTRILWDKLTPDLDSAAKKTSSEVFPAIFGNPPNFWEL
jgi:hypothetical protein